MQDASPPQRAPAHSIAEPPLAQLVARAGLVNKVTTRLVMPLLVIAVIVGELLDSEHDIEWRLGPILIEWYFGLIVIFAGALGTGWALRRSGRPERWLFVRSLMMTGFITAAIPFTGGLTSPAWMLFMLNVIAAALLLPRGFSWVAYGFIAASSLALLLIEHETVDTTLFVLLVREAALLAAFLIVRSLSERTDAQYGQLAESVGSLHRHDRQSQALLDVTAAFNPSLRFTASLNSALSTVASATEARYVLILLGRPDEQLHVANFVDSDAGPQPSDPERDSAFSMAASPVAMAARSSTPVQVDDLLAAPDGRFYPVAMKIWDAERRCRPTLFDGGQHRPWGADGRIR